MRHLQLAALLLLGTVMCLLVTSGGGAPTVKPGYRRVQQPDSRDLPTVIELRLELRSLQPWYSGAEPPVPRDVPPAIPAPRDVPPGIEQLRLLELRAARDMLCY